MNDPFSTTYEGRFKAGTALGSGLQTAAEVFAKGVQSRAEKQKTPLEALKEVYEVEKLRKELSGELTDKETLGRATVLRKEFNTDQAYKNFQILQRSEDQMKEAYRLATSKDVNSRVAADQALAVTFQKMLDPSSVVRESEYARTPEGVSLMNRMGSFVEQLQKGGLTIKDEDRLALIQAASKMLKSGQRQMNSHIRRYKSLSKDYRVPARYVLGDIDEFNIPKTFMLNGEPYEIPEDEVEAFLSENPTAQEI